ncbi:MAG: thioredoxin domain-containing protein, partial [Candidatus Aminicenantes bacterium]
MSPNRLIREKSPYLLQHASNPINWYPWNNEAFKKAKREDRPIFLSIGYSTCHWCHVMEQESFEDEQVARLMNENFVSIKVDREERPDIDNVYMKICQMITGRGGWPLTVIMTPDKKPFFAGTYLPKKRRFNQIGMMDLIPRIGELWKTQRRDLLASAEKIVLALGQQSVQPRVDGPNEEVLNQAFRQLAQGFDAQYGGFSQAPKFPTPHNISFLLRYWKRTANDSSLHMVEKTLRAMRRGGIFDHIGYGFHRYSTDRHWLLPHFEKMLYDQALLAMAYTETYLVTKDDFYRKAAEEIFIYVLRDMTSPDGPFFSAEDADSEGEEGKFYTWTWDELKKHAGTEDLTFLSKVFGVHESGNFSDEVTGTKPGTNILHLPSSIEELTRELRQSVEDLEVRTETLRQKLFQIREKRKHPLKDDKILADWNGLMIAALGKAARAFNRTDYYEAADKASDFILGSMRQRDGTLFHRYRNGESKISAYADDYAYLIWGQLELYEASFQEKHLHTALDLNEIFIRHFWDESKGAFFFTSDTSDTLFLRQKESYDGATPSSNSVAMMNLLRLSRMTGRSAYEEKAAQLSEFFSGNVSSHPSAYTQMLCAIDMALGPSYEIVIAGDAEDKETQTIIRTIQEEFVPNAVLIYIPEAQDNPAIYKLAPFTRQYGGLKGSAAAYVCSNFTCQQPTSDPEKLLQFLGIKPTDP